MEAPSFVASVWVKLILPPSSFGCTNPGRDSPRKFAKTRSARSFLLALAAALLLLVLFSLSLGVPSGFSSSNPLFLDGFLGEAFALAFGLALAFAFPFALAFGLAFAAVFRVFFLGEAFAFAPAFAFAFDFGDAFSGVTTFTWLGRPLGFLGCLLAAALASCVCFFFSAFSKAARSSSCMEFINCTHITHKPFGSKYFLIRSNSEFFDDINPPQKILGSIRHVHSALHTCNHNTMATELYIYDLFLLFPKLGLLLSQIFRKLLLFLRPWFHKRTILYIIYL